jgi:hypothetical protein
MIFSYTPIKVCELRRLDLVSWRKKSIIIRMSLKSSRAFDVHLADLMMVFQEALGQQIGDSGRVAVGLYCFVELAAQYSAYMARGCSSRNTEVARDTQDTADARRPFTPSLSRPPRCMIIVSMPFSCQLKADSSLPITSLMMSCMIAIILWSDTLASGFSIFWPTRWMTSCRSAIVWTLSSDRSCMTS